MEKSLDEVEDGLLEFSGRLFIEKPAEFKGFDGLEDWVFGVLKTEKK